MRRTAFFFIAAISFLLSACPSGSDPDLANSYWVLTELDGKAIDANELGGKPIFLHLPEGAGGRAEGFAGCNAFFGECRVEGKKVTFSRLGSTKMMCPQMPLEQAFLNALQQVEKFKREGEELHLLQGERKWASFRKVAEQPGS